MKRILIIKHGSLGDIIFSLPVIHSIVSYHSQSQIDLLTEKKYFNFFKNSNYFSKLIQDNRSKNLLNILNILLNINKRKYDLVIDLQNSSRTTYYNLFFRIFSNTKICSSRKFSHFKYNIPSQGSESSTQGLFNQIKILNIPQVINLNYNWLQSIVDKEFDSKIILFIPGVSKSGKYKQWDPSKFGKLAKYIEKLNYKICVVGTKQDKEDCLPILNGCKNIINKIDNSPPNIIYSIARKSSLVISNDTGPGHLAALSGAKMLWIVNDNNISKANISQDSKNFIISSNSVDDISMEEVINFINKNKLL